MGIENTIDTLRLDIVVNSNNGAKTIKDTSKAVDKLSTSLQSADFSKLERLSKALDTFNSATSGLGDNVKGLSSLNTRLRTLNTNLTKIDTTVFKAKFADMTAAITPFIDKVNSAQASLQALQGVMGGAKTLTKANITPKATAPKSSGVGNKLNTALNIGSIVGKLYFVRNITKQLGQDLAKVVQYGIDYEETLNLWQVAMRGNTAEARKFVNEMNKAYGISEAMLMNYQATFKNMLGALGGIKPEDAYGLSEVLTQMALDYASLYNTSIESAMTKFQAVLAGQVRPIRNESGYDITQATLFEVYKDIGGTKSIRQLTETEKRLLRILAVYRQMKDTAFEDMSRTITSTANQARFMSETVKEIATWIGVGANQWLHQKNTLIKINAYLLALRELAIQFAKNMGYVEPVEDNKLKEPIEETEDAFDGLNKQVDEYSKKLLGFDKFQVLTDTSTENGSDISLTILEELKKVREEYDKIRRDTQNLALFGDADKGIKGAYDILEQFGWKLTYVKDEMGNIVEDAEGNPLQQWTKDGKTVKENIEEIAKSIGGLITFIGLMTKPWIVFVGAIEYAYWTNEEFRNSFNGMIKAVGSSGITIFRNFAEILKDISPALTAIVGGFADVISFLDRIGLLEFAIWGVVTAMIAWKTAQAAINIMKFYENIVKYLVPAITSASLAIRKQLAASLIAAQLNFGKFGLAMTAVTAQTIGFGAAIGLAFAVLTNWEYMNGIQKIVSVLGVLTVALLSAAIAFGAFHSAWSLGLAVAGIAAGIVAVTASVNSAKANIDSMEVPKYAKGGSADKGSLFIAGEAGPELVTKTSGGNSTIMNMEQLNEAVRLGFIGGLKSTEFLKFANELFDRLSRISLFSAITKKKGIFGFADGGLADRGSLFYAGEAGPELVTQTSGGGSTIMNMKQLEDAVARGFIRGFASTDKGYEDNDTTEVYVDGQRLFNIMRGTAKRNGYDFVKV